MVKLFGGRGYVLDHTGSCLPIMTSVAGCSLPNNFTIDYTKLKQKRQNRHYREQCYDVQYAACDFGASSS